MVFIMQASWTHMIHTWYTHDSVRKHHEHTWYTHDKVRRHHEHTWYTHDSVRNEIKTFGTAWNYLIAFA